MSKQKIKNGRHKLFNLSDNEINLIEQFTRDLEFKSQSEFVGWLVRNYYINSDPLQELEQIKIAKEKLQKEIKKLELKEQEVIYKLKAHKQAQKEKEELKKKAIEILKKKIRENANRFDIEDISKYWAFRLNITPEELIYNATLSISLEKQNKRI